MKKKGFTLIELMITLSIFVVFIGFVYSAYFSQIRISNNMNSAYNAEVRARNITKIISNAIRNNYSQRTDNPSVGYGLVNQILKVSDNKINQVDNLGNIIGTLVEYDSVEKKLKILGQPDIDCVKEGIDNISFEQPQDSNMIQVIVSAADKYGTFQLKTGININN